MRNTIVHLSCAIIGLFAISSAFAQSDAQFAKANQEYADRNFKEAIDGYDQLVRSGQWSANLFYDLGNAYFRVGDFGHAILNYERALALDPRHPEANANLQIARDEARALELQQSRLERYLRSATTNQYTTAAAITFLAGSVLCCRSDLCPPSFWPPDYIVDLFLVDLCVARGRHFLDRQRKQGRALAIVTASGVEARVATADTANSVLALPAGSEIKIASQRGDWIYAMLPNNLRGWVPAKSVSPVRL